METSERRIRVKPYLDERTGMVSVPVEDVRTDFGYIFGFYHNRRHYSYYSDGVEKGMVLYRDVTPD